MADAEGERPGGANRSSGCDPKFRRIFPYGMLVEVVSFGQSWVCASSGYVIRTDTSSVLEFLDDHLP